MKQPLGTWPCDGCIWGICGRRGTLPLTHPAKGGHRHSGPLAALLARKAFGWCQGLRSCLATCAFSLQHSVCTPRFASNELGVICACDWLLLFHLCHPPPPSNCFPSRVYRQTRFNPPPSFGCNTLVHQNFPQEDTCLLTPPPWWLCHPDNCCEKLQEKGWGAISEGVGSTEGNTNNFLTCEKKYFSAF